VILFKNGGQDAQTPLMSGSKAGWLEDLDADSEHLAVYIRHGTNSSLKVLSRSENKVSNLAPLGPVSTLRPSAKLTNDPELKVSVRSFLRPTQSLSLSSLLSAQGDPKSTRRTDCLDCVEESLEVKSSDGALVPISIARPRNPRGLLVLTYGSYGISQSAEFSELHQSLLQRGFVVALAHVRGGSERGPGWSTQARALDKTRSVTDLLATLEFLQGHLKVPPGKTFVWGRSAGGWLVTKAATTKPMLIRGLLLEAPLLDVRAAISSSKSPLFHSERLEWGTVAAATLSALPTTPLPFHILIQLPLKDELISPFETVRWAIAAECAQPKGYTMLVETLSNASHAGPDSKAEQTDWSSLQESFLTNFSESF
jgi:oligopeptidase B